MKPKSGHMIKPLIRTQYQPHPFVPKVDDDHSYDNGVHDIQTDSPSAAKDSDAMSILHDHIAEAPPSQLHGEVPGEQPVREQALEEIANLHDEPRDRDTKTAADAPSPNSESVYDDTFLQATELPGFRFGRNDLPARDTSTASPSPSTSLNGGASLGASDQHAAVVPVAPNQELPPHSDGSMNPPEPRSVPATFSPTPQPEPQGPVGPSALVNNANDVLEAAPSESAPTTMVDSAFDDGASATFSMTDTLDSSVSHYRWENGRRYHAYRDGAYWGPNDELHNDQQDIAHKAWTLSIGDRLFMAPLNGPKIQRCLDVGTGTGLWAIEFAEMFPHAQVTGTDLSPIQPVWVPPNCMFEVDDVSMEWTFRKDSFDFIHSREMFGSIADWDFFFQQCFAHIKPGGYVECLERGVKPMSDDDTVGPDHFYTLWGNTVLEMGMKWGKGFDAFEIIRERMERAGFVDVVETKMKWPIGGWAKEKHMQELGLWNAVRLDTGIEGYVMRLFTQAGGVSLRILHHSAFSRSYQEKANETATVVLRRSASLPGEFPPMYARPIPPRLSPWNMRLWPETARQ